MFNLGMGEILLLAFLGLLIFGKRLPEVGRNLGKGILEFKKGLSGSDDEAAKAASGREAHTLAAPSTGSPAPTQADLQEQLRLANERLKALEQQAQANRSDTTPRT